jgi:hypothetical protein
VKPKQAEYPITKSQSPNNHQYPSTNHQTWFGDSVIGDWNLFGAWNLVFGDLQTCGF